MPKKSKEKTWISDDGDVTIEKLKVAMTPEKWQVIHLVGNQGRNTDVNSVISCAFMQAQIDMPHNVVAQVNGLTTPMSATNRNNLILALAIGIMITINRNPFKNIDEHLVMGSLDIAGNVHPPIGISADLANQLAAANGLKTLGCTKSGADVKLDTIVGLVP